MKRADANSVLSSEELLAAFPTLRGRLVASLARLVDSTEAEDLANETLLRALSSVGGFRGEAALGTWLHRIGINLAYDLLRRRSASPIQPLEAAVDIPEATDGTTTVGEALERRQASQCIGNLLTSLPPQQREVLVHADMLENPVAKIACDAGITAGNAKIRLHRARRAMKAALEENCILYHGSDGQLLCMPKS